MYPHPTPPPNPHPTHTPPGRLPPRAAASSGLPGVYLGSSAQLPPPLPPTAILRPPTPTRDTSPPVTPPPPPAPLLVDLLRDSRRRCVGSVGATVVDGAGVGVSWVCGWGVGGCSRVGGAEVVRCRGSGDVVWGGVSGACGAGMWSGGAWCVVVEVVVGVVDDDDACVWGGEGV